MNIKPLKFTVLKEKSILDINAKKNNLLVSRKNTKSINHADNTSKSEYYNVSISDDARTCTHKSFMNQTGFNLKKENLESNYFITSGQTTCKQQLQDKCQGKYNRLKDFSGCKSKFHYSSNDINSPVSNSQNNKEVSFHNKSVTVFNFNNFNKLLKSIK